MDSFKRNSDFITGKSRREYMNTYLKLFLSDLYELERIHSHLKTMTHVNEKVKNNKLSHRIIPTEFQKAMGLDYRLTKENSQCFIYIRYIIVDHKKGNVYMKLPAEYKENWQEYLRICSSLGYHFIIVDITDKANPKYSFPIHIDVFIKHWTPVKRESKGNKNRLDFHGKLSNTIPYLLHPTYENIYGESVVKSLEALIP